MDMMVSPPSRTELSPIGSRPTPPSAEAPACPAMPPAAVVAVSVPAGHAAALRPFLAALKASRAAGGVPVARGALAVLVLTDETEAAMRIAEAVSPGYPFPLRVEGTAGGPLRAAGRAAEWAAALNVPDAPVLLADARAPVPPRWVYETLSALRDGADVVSRRTGPLARLLFGPGWPVAFSGRARRAVEPCPSGAARGVAGQPDLRVA